MDDSERLSLPSDLYSRNLIIAEGIRQYKQQYYLSRVRILDVGGRNGKLHLFLDPGDDLTLLDVHQGEEMNLVIGDATDMNFFQNGTFDIVVSGDVYEHIPSERRELFLTECLRVSKDLVILAAPFYSPGVKEAESMLNDFFRNQSGRDHPWLKEHLENGLPHEQKLLQFFQHHHLKYSVVPSNDLENWILLQFLVFYSFSFGVSESFIRRFYMTYNRDLLSVEDFGEGSYRQVYAFSRRPFSFQFSYALDIKKRFALRHKAFEVIASFTREKTLDLTEKGRLEQGLRDEEMRNKDNHIRNLDAQVQEYLLQLSKRNERILQKNDFIREQHQELQNVRNERNVLKKKSFRKSRLLRHLSFSHQVKIDEIASLHRQKADIEQRLQFLNQEISQLRPEVLEFRAVKKSLTYRFLVFHRLLTGVFFRYLLRIRQGLQLLTRPGGLKILFSVFLNFFRKQSQHLPSLPSLSLNEQYVRYLHQNSFISRDLLQMRRDVSRFAYLPLISIITPVYNVDPEWLNKCIESVMNQAYLNWELCLYDDASTNPKTLECLKSWGKKDPRLKIRFGQENCHISGASNAALEMSDGEFVGLLDHDDELTPNALFEVVKLLNQDQSIDMIYSDEDKLELDGTRVEPHFKPDWSPETFESLMYSCHFGVYRRSLIQEIGGFRQGYEGSQDYDLVLRFTEMTQNVRHIPQVLYHWRKIPGSAAFFINAKSYAHEAAENALLDRLLRENNSGRIHRNIALDTYRVQRDILGEPLVSIIIPFKDKADYLERCVKSVLRSQYRHVEILLVSNNSVEKRTFEMTDMLCRSDQRIRFERYDLPFNFSAMNNWAAEKVNGDFLLFLNNDTEAIHDDWIEAMLE